MLYSSYWKAFSQTIYYCGQADAWLKKKRKLSTVRTETFRAQRRAPETRILSIARRVLRDTLPRFGINSRASSLLWRPSILHELSFWDMEKQISPLPFSGQTNGKPPSSLRDIVSHSFDDADVSTKATFYEINRMRSRSIVCTREAYLSSGFYQPKAYFFALRIRSYIVEFCLNEFKWFAIRIALYSDYDTFNDL